MKSIAIVFVFASSVLACDRDDPKPGRERPERDLVPASLVQPQNSPMGTPMPGQNAGEDNPTPRSASSAPSQSAGPSAVGQTHAAPADDARDTVQSGSREAPFGHDTSTLADERPAGPEPSHGRR